MDDRHSKTDRLTFEALMQRPEWQRVIADARAFRSSGSVAELIPNTLVLGPDQTRVYIGPKKYR